MQTNLQSLCSWLLQSEYLYRLETFSISIRHYICSEYFKVWSIRFLVSENVIQFILEHFTKRTNKFCSKFQRKRYTTLDGAKQGCLKDTKCGGFYDADGAGIEFFDCTKPVVERDSNKGSVLYIKDGKFNILLWSLN